MKGGINRNTELTIITWVIAGLFVLMAGYLVYFQIARREQIVSNVYNTKQDPSSDRIIRGSIKAENGEDLAYTTVDYTGNPVRNYPYGRIFAHALGYAGNGKAGLESFANKELTSSHSSLMNQLKYAANSEKAQGDTVVVTLSPSLQQAAWYALGDYRGAVVVMEPDSGKILAMVSKPDFDPNTIEQDWESMMNDSQNSSLLNRATSGLYPPGSVFKILTALAYLREHRADDTGFLYDCSGIISREDVDITCYNGTAHGQESLKSAFANSCNTAFASIGLDLDLHAFRSLAEEFLFNRTLPTSLMHNTSVFPLKGNESEGERMTTSIGQGDTLVTPLHMAMITSTVANAGTMMKPYMIDHIETGDGELVQETKPEIYDELMTLEEAQKLTSYMRETVVSGTAAALGWNSYSVAGKTGSAEYETDGVTGTHSWFVGFSNIDDPDIVVAVIAEDGGTGSTTAVPIAQKIFDAYYYN